MPRRDASELQDDIKSGVENAAGRLYVPWQTISALASETGQAVRQTFSDSAISTSGHVQQGLQYHVSPSEKCYHTPRLNEALPDTGQAARKVEDAPASGVVNCEAVQADIQRVKQKLVSTDAATEVVLRFNFMGSKESKVRRFCRSATHY